jgi:spore germination protein KB
LKISGSQLFWIVATTLVVMSIWLTITPVIQISKQDAWLSMLVGDVIVVALTFFAVHLSRLHPNQTLVEFSQALLGKWLGRIIVLPYFISWYTLSAVLLRSFGDFIHLIALDKTPVWMIMILMIGLMIYLTYSGGITGIGRFSEIAGPLLFLTIIISFILSIGNIRWHQLLPVYSDSGWTNILKGSFIPASFLGEIFMLLVIVSFMHHPQKALSRSMLGVGTAAFIVFIATILVLLVFGPNFSAKLRFPYFMLIRSIDILNFIQNVDLLVLFFWTFGVFVKVSLYLFITSYEMAKWFNVKDWRRMIWLGAPAIFIMAILIPNEIIPTLYSKFWELIVVPVCGIGIPFLLWIVSLAKKKGANPA